MKLTVACLLFILLLVPFSLRAQMEAAVWALGNGKQFNFQSGSFQYLDFEGSPNIDGTICDKNGNLLLMTDGDTVWNGNNEVLINGTGLIEEGYDRISWTIPPVFVPYPGKEGYYFLIYQYGIETERERLIPHSHTSITMHEDGTSDTVVVITYTSRLDTVYLDQKLVYAEIDINAAGGQGKVISKQNFIVSDDHVYQITDPVTYRIKYTIAG